MLGTRLRDAEVDYASLAFAEELFTTLRGEPAALQGDLVAGCGDERVDVVLFRRERMKTERPDQNTGRPLVQRLKAKGGWGERTM